LSSEKIDQLIRARIAGRRHYRYIAESGMPL
jgi:hypothetical protein